MTSEQASEMRDGPRRPLSLSSWPQSPESAAAVNGHTHTSTTVTDTKAVASSVTCRSIARRPRQFPGYLCQRFAALLRNPRSNCPTAPPWPPCPWTCLTPACRAAWPLSAAAFAISRPPSLSLSLSLLPLHSPPPPFCCIPSATTQITRISDLAGPPSLPSSLPTIGPELTHRTLRSDVRVQIGVKGIEHPPRPLRHTLPGRDTARIGNRFHRASIRCAAYKLPSLFAAIPSPGRAAEPRSIKPPGCVALLRCQRIHPPPTQQQQHHHQHQHHRLPSASPRRSCHCFLEAACVSLICDTSLSHPAGHWLEKNRRTPRICLLRSTL